MELTCKIQNYAWGKKGSNSKVATLYSNVNKEFKLEEDVPYAELWMGTHINGPSIVKEDGRTLASLICEHPEYLGEKVAKSFNNELPFLFKVLSVDKALSIQAHPSKRHAEELHAKYPDIYKDANHKPELAIALTPFQALCGFRPVSQIKSFIQEIPELGRLIKDCQGSCNDHDFLKTTFKSVLTCEKEILSKTIDDIIYRFKKADENERVLYHADIIERLNNEFPYDNGVLMVYFLNYIQLKPAEAIYLAANEPHAYLFGDCIENMACSDNVVRAGLTPKFVDIDTLCSMLNYKGEEPTEKLFTPIDEDEYTKLYKPPVIDFAVAGIQIPISIENYKLIKRESASILIVISGSAKIADAELKAGTTLFIPANDTLNISDITEEILIYQAFANI